MSAALAMILACLAPQDTRELTPDTYESIRTHVELSERDLAFQNIPWKRTMFDAIAEARATDKPIFLWLYFGDPRALC